MRTKALQVHRNVRLVSRFHSGFQGGQLAIIDIPSSGEPKDTIVACSGFDGLIEDHRKTLLGDVGINLSKHA